MILDMLVANRRCQVRELREKTPLPVITERAFEYHMTHRAADFAASLGEFGLSVIAEIKKASPSKGLIREDFDPAAIAREYEQAGADACSVLTEETYFKGSGEVLRTVRGTVGLPLLRKDFIFDEWQICEARLLGADAVLLIASVLDLFELKKFIAVSEMLGMQCLVEAHDPGQVKNALRAGAKIVGVNNRDLATFEVDFGRAQALRALVPRDVLFVAESGIRTPGDMRRMEEIGADAVLMGEVLMRAPSPGEKLREMKGYRYAAH